MADFQLPVGAQTQTVNVEGQVSQVETQSTAVGALVEGKQIRDLPLNGRNFTQLLTLAPGVTQIPLGAPGAGSTFYGNGQKYSIAGSRPSGQAYLLDDQDMVNFWNNGPGAGGLGTALGVDAIAEFQTLTNTYSAQFGGNGAVINASSQSGTNAFHGTAFDFLRNNKLESRNFFDNASSAPPFRRNQFGGSIGGPIKKDKIFFFANYEGLRSTQILTNIVTVPDQCAHQFLTSTAHPGRCGAPVAQNGTPYATNLAVRQAIQGAMALYPNTAFNELSAGGNAQRHRASLRGESQHRERELSAGARGLHVVRQRLAVRPLRDGPRHAQLHHQRSLLARTRYHSGQFRQRGGAAHYLRPLGEPGARRILADLGRCQRLRLASRERHYRECCSPVPSVLAGVTVTPGTIATAGNHPLQFFGTAAGREDGTLVDAFQGHHGARRQHHAAVLSGPQ